MSSVRPLTRFMRMWVRPQIARLRVQGGDVPGPIADDRKSFLGDGGKHQFPGFPVGQDLAAVGVDDFGNKMIFEDVQSLFGFVAFDGHPRPHHFAQAVNVNRRQIELLFDFVTHTLRPGLGPEDPELEIQIFKGDSHLFGHLGQMKGVRWGGRQYGGAEIFHDGNLAFGIPAGHRK